ncbi:MAG: flagellar basal body rod protein FlgB [Pseudohongiellaceae bacterium]
MIDKLSEAFAFQQQALSLRHERQQVLASNIANADTPNYKARDIDFSAELSRAMRTGAGAGGNLELATTSSGHLSGGSGASNKVEELLYRVPQQSSLDGNTVEMESERARFADNSLRYQTSLTFMNSTITGLKTAMRPE